MFDIVEDYDGSGNANNKHTLGAITAVQVLKLSEEIVRFTGCCADCFVKSLSATLLFEAIKQASRKDAEKYLKIVMEEIMMAYDEENEKGNI